MQGCKETAKYFAPLLFKAANILRSRAGKQFIHSLECRFEKMDMQILQSNLLELFQGVAKQSAAGLRILDLEGIALLEQYFRRMGDSLCETFDTELTHKFKNERFNSDNIKPAVYKFADDVLHDDWYSHYPTAMYTSRFPADFTYALYAIKAFGSFLYAKRTLQLNTGVKHLETFLNKLTSDYLTKSPSSPYIHDILVIDVNGLKSWDGKEPYFIRYLANYPSSGKVTEVVPHENYVYVDFKTGAITGNCETMFGDRLKKLAA